MTSDNANFTRSDILINDNVNTQITIMVDSTYGTFIYSLPGSAVVNDIYIINDIGGVVSINNITIEVNGIQYIYLYVMSVDNAIITFKYDGNTWNII